MSIGDGYQTYSDSTLKNCKKDELIGFIRVLEENLRNAYERLDNQAKILHDQEPVKHASWIYCDLDGTGICSSCRSYGNSQDSYCSNCGAKMDLEGEQVETHQVV